MKKESNMDGGTTEGEKKRGRQKGEHLLPSLEAAGLIRAALGRSALLLVLLVLVELGPQLHTESLRQVPACVDGNG